MIQNKRQWLKPLLAITLFVGTAGVVWLASAKVDSSSLQINVPVPAPAHLTTVDQPLIDVVFVLDTTSSMGGLIQAAKEKIWAVASTMANAQPAPQIRMGLVAFRDRGDAYVTQVYDLSPDLDQMYLQLMQFQAQGGGDGPESVNQALHEAVHQISWSNGDDAYKVIFLVGDAPPHMDYANDVPYHQSVAEARQRGIVVNTIQCGADPNTTSEWQSIAQLGYGQFLQVEQSGGAVAVASPYDDKIVALAEKLEATRLYYGDEDRRAEADRKAAVSKSITAASPKEASVSRAMFNVSASGRSNFLGDSELIDEVAISQSRSLDSIPEAELPASLQVLPAPARQAKVEAIARERQQLQAELLDLQAQRDDYLAEAMPEAEESLERKVYEVVKEQAATKGLSYSKEDGE
ncbi:MAG: hypothetical protein Tsb002_19100 [Wenzhouxiangellaceae bacterium]